MSKYVQKGWLLPLLLLGFVLFPNASLAHTGLVSSEPKESTVTASPVTEIKLKFNTTIEKVSKIELENSAGEPVELKETKYGTDTMTGLLAAPLPNDTYNVNWRIIGKDGHKVTGNYSFQVKVSEPLESAPPEPTQQQEPASESPAEPSSAASEPPASSAASELPVAEEASSTDNDQQLSGYILVAAGAIFVLFVILYVIKKRSKT